MTRPHRPHHDVTGLTSDGNTVNYAFLNGVLVGYTGNNPHPNEVFTVSLNDNGDGSYTFTLLGTLDHPPGQGTNLLNFTFNYTATDSDGDTSNNVFTVSVKDSVPLAFDAGLQPWARKTLPTGTHACFGAAARTPDRQRRRSTSPGAPTTATRPPAGHQRSLGGVCIEPRVRSALSSAEPDLGRRGAELYRHARRHWRQTLTASGRRRPHNISR